MKRKLSYPESELCSISDNVIYKHDRKRYLIIIIIIVVVVHSEVINIDRCGIYQCAIYKVIIQ